MSDLAATNCGCPREDGGCNSIIWIILLLCCCCGNGRSGFLGDGGCGGGNDCCWIIILLLLCGGNFCGGGGCCQFSSKKGAIYRLPFFCFSSVSLFFSCLARASLILHSALIFLRLRHSSSTSYTLFPSMISPTFLFSFSLSLFFYYRLCIRTKGSDIE